MNLAEIFDYAELTSTVPEMSLNDDEVTPTPIFPRTLFLTTAFSEKASVPTKSRLPSLPKKEFCADENVGLKQKREASHKERSTKRSIAPFFPKGKSFEDSQVKAPSGPWDFSNSLSTICPEKPKIVPSLNQLPIVLGPLPFSKSEVLPSPEKDFKISSRLGTWDFSNLFSTDGPQKLEDIPSPVHFPDLRPKEIVVKSISLRDDETSSEEEGLPVPEYGEISSESEDETSSEEEGPHQSVQELRMIAGAPTEIGPIEGGMPQKRRRPKGSRGRPKGGKGRRKIRRPRQGMSRSVPLGQPQSKLVRVREVAYGNITNVGGTTASELIPLTGLGQVTALGGVTLDNTVGINAFTPSYDLYKVIDVHVKVSLNNNEANTNILFGVLTNQIPVANSANNFQAAQGRHSRSKFVTEHNTLSAAWFRFSMSIHCPSLFGNAKTYLGDDNTAGSCNATTGPPPVPTAPANNIYLVFGGTLPKAGAVYTAAGVNYEIVVTKTVRFYEVRAQTG